MVTFLIAEVGSNHGNQLYRAKDLIYQAKEAGADAVKFQLYRADSLAKKRNAQDYWHTYKATELPDNWLPELREACYELGVVFLCTAYDNWGVNAVAPYVPMFKVASFEANDHPLLAYISHYNRPVILSTGMCTSDEGRQSIRVLGANNVRYLLHCVSSYHAQESQVNLNVLASLT